MLLPLIFSEKTKDMGKKRLIKDSQISEVLDALETMHPEAMCALDHGSEFELLVAVVLSAQTTDVSVNKVTPELFRKYPSPEALAAAPQADVIDTIKTIGLYKTKSANIIKLAQKLVDEFGGVVPDAFDELVSLPGVGRKTANVVMSVAFHHPAIAVDTHVFRVANRLKLAVGETPLEVEKGLQKVLPREKWSDAHHWLIWHGRKLCRARKPLCVECPLKLVCPAANAE